MKGTLSFYLSEFIQDFTPVFFMGTILIFVAAISLVADGYFDKIYTKYHSPAKSLKRKNHNIAAENQTNPSKS